MKTVTFVLLLSAFGLSSFAGATITPTPLPDAGASLLLLSLGVITLGLARRAFRS